MKAHSLIALLILCLACTAALADDSTDVALCPTCGSPVSSHDTETHEYYASNACSIGPRFSEDSSLTDEWFMFTPIDLSQEGFQYYDLIAGDMHKLGTAVVQVKEGNVTVKVVYVCDDIIVRDTFMTLFNSIDDVTSVDPDDLEGYSYGAKISIAEDLGGDTQVLLYIRNAVSYPVTDAHVEPFSPACGDYAELVLEMVELMD